MPQVNYNHFYYILDTKTKTSSSRTYKDENYQYGYRNSVQWQCSSSPPSNSRQIPKIPNESSSEQPRSSTTHSPTPCSPTPPPNYVSRKIEKTVVGSYSSRQQHSSTPPPKQTQRIPAAPITPSGVSSYLPRSESPKSVPGGFLLPLKRDELHDILKNYIPCSTFYELVQECQALRSEMRTPPKKDKKSSKNRSSLK